jgi:hypothetical protein
MLRIYSWNIVLIDHSLGVILSVDWILCGWSVTCVRSIYYVGISSQVRFALRHTNCVVKRVYGAWLSGHVVWHPKYVCCFCYLSLDSFSCRFLRSCLTSLFATYNWHFWDVKQHDPTVKLHKLSSQHS